MTTNTPPPVGNYIAVCACGREFEARRWRDGTSTESLGCPLCQAKRRSGDWDGWSGRLLRLGRGR